MDDTEHSITWCERRIPYSIRRHGRRIFPGVNVLPGGKVEVLAPPDFNRDAAEALVAEEAAWIVQRHEGVVCGYTAAPYEFVTGESITYLGRSYRLKVVPGEAGELKLRYGCLEVPVRKETRQAVRGALVSWFRGKAEERLPGGVEAWHEAVGVAMPPVVVANQRKRPRELRPGRDHAPQLASHPAAPVVDGLRRRATAGAPAGPATGARLLAGARACDAGLPLLPRGAATGRTGTVLVVQVPYGLQRYGTGAGEATAAS